MLEGLDCIYIPIWSYFYVMNNVKDKLLNKFTFQYGATSTCKGVLITGFPSLFTFQYGATSTDAERVHCKDNLGFTFQYGATSTN